MQCSARAVDSIGLAGRCMCGLFMVALEHQSPIRAQSLPVEQSAPMVQLEEIYIARSVPDSRIRIHEPSSKINLIPSSRSTRATLRPATLEGASSR